MRKKTAILAAIFALNALAVGSWAAQRAQRRAKEVAVLEGSIKIKAAGLLNTTLDVYDGNDIANAGFDFDLVENHREALLELGFSSVHIETATGQTLDRPL